MKSDTLLIFHILPILSLLLSATYIFALRGNKRPTNFIFWARLLTAALLFANFFEFHGTPYYMQVLLNPLHILMCLIAYPLLFAYLYLLMRPGSVRPKYWVFAYSPVVLLILLTCFFRYSHGAFSPIISYEGFKTYENRPEIVLRLVALMVFVAELIFFAMQTLKMQHIHKQKLALEFSYTEGASLEWVRWNIFLSLTLGITALLGITCEGLIFKIAAGILLTIEPIVSTMLVLRQKDLYRQVNHFIIPEKDKLENTDNNDMKVLSQEKYTSLKQALLRLLEEDEIFKDPELNGEKVREMLATNRTYLSQVINHDLNTNFYQLINTYRLNKALKMMQAALTQNMPLKNIAEICGFKSPSAFTTYFKEKKGCSPSEWMKNNLT